MLFRSDQLEYQKAEAELKAREEVAKAVETPAEAPAAAPVKRTFCPHCGAPLKNPNAKFCGSCGQPLN